MKEYYLVYYDNGMEYSDYSWHAEFVCLTEESAKSMAEKMNADIALAKQMGDERWIIIEDWDKNNPRPIHYNINASFKDPDYIAKYHEWNTKRQELFNKINKELSKKFNIKSDYPNDGSFGVMIINGE